MNHFLYNSLDCVRAGLVSDHLDGTPHIPLDAPQGKGVCRVQND